MSKNPASRRLGRPPAADSADTRQRILVAAREAFAAEGYEVATNRSLAAAAGITSGALYHYFESKLDLYAAIFVDVETVIFERFAAAAAPLDSFLDKFDAVLDESHRLNTEDRTLAQFIGAVRIDRARHPEIDAAILTRGARPHFFRSLIDHGVATGEVPTASKAMVATYLDVVLTGLTDAVSHDDDRHSRAIDGIKAAMRGTLLHG